MATRPTKLQQKARENQAQALLLIAEASRLDGREALDRSSLTEIASRIARACTAFSLEEIVARALERRALGLGLPASTAEILSLVESDLRPIDMLLLDDESFRETATKIEEDFA
jgi:hypothetical protein